MRRGEVWILHRGRRVVLNRLLFAAPTLEKVGEAVVGFRQPRIETQRFLVLLQRSARIAGPFQRRGQLLHGAPVVPLCERRAPQLEAHGRLVWMERQRLAESPFGLRRTA